MTLFDQRLWSDTDPAYAPFLNRAGAWLYWRPSSVWRKQGWKGENVRLTGQPGDGMDMDRAAECRRLTREMLRSLGVAPGFEVGTWSWLINRYKSDRYSPFRDVKGNTAEGYRKWLAVWDAEIGRLSIDAMTFEKARGIEADMRDAGRSASYIKRVFTMLRTVAAYGANLGLRDAREASAVLSGIRLKSPPKRSAAATRAQVMAVVDEADRRGLHGYACGLLIQWVFMLRGVDVFGQWIEARPGEGGIQRDGQRWQDGLTWDMLEPDLSGFRKVISKTAGSMPDPMGFDLTSCPEIRSRLRLLGSGGRIGPVIVTEKHRLPYTTDARGKVWQRLSADLGLPAGVRMMDMRSGAITEAKSLGAGVLALRDAAQHMNSDTTQGYMRGRDEAAAKVVRLRGER